MLGWFMAAPEEKTLLMLGFIVGLIQPCRKK
jgi:hypothetical protein